MLRCLMSLTLVNKSIEKLLEQQHPILGEVTNEAVATTMIFLLLNSQIH
ncbi:hypothetical protein ACTNEO_12525 [Gracilibacillus sp. HCP3S3_G5_1]